MCASPNACIRGTEKPSEQELFARGGAVAVFMVLSFVVTPAARRGRDLTSSLRVRTTRLATRTMLVERAGRDDGVSRIPASAATTPEVRFAVPLAVGLTTRTRRSGSRGAGFRSISTGAYRTHPAAERQLPPTERVHEQSHDQVAVPRNGTRVPLVRTPHGSTPPSSGQAFFSF